MTHHIDPEIELQATRDELERVQERLNAYRSHAKRWKERALKNLAALDDIRDYIHDLKGDLHNDY